MMELNKIAPIASCWHPPFRCPSLQQMQMLESIAPLCATPKQFANRSSLCFMNFGFCSIKPIASFFNLGFCCLCINNNIFQHLVSSAHSNSRTLHLRVSCARSTDGCWAAIQSNRFPKSEICWTRRKLTLSCPRRTSTNIF